MTTKQEYDKVHHAAKVIVMAMVILLLILGRTYDTVIMDILAVAIWFFGVNLVAYIIESVLHFNHKHNLF